MVNRDNQKFLRNIALGVFFVFILIFSFFRSYELIFGVEIKNINIENGATVYKSIENITGTARHAVSLTLNGREIYVDKKGNFNEMIALSLGYNIISIEAKDKFGSRDYKDYQLIYKQNEKSEQ